MTERKHLNCYAALALHSMMRQAQLFLSENLITDSPSRQRNSLSSVGYKTLKLHYRVYVILPLDRVPSQIN
jgi:hypothetical protein